MFNVFAIIVSTIIFGNVVSAGVMPLISCPGEVTTGELVHLIIPDCDWPPCVLRKGRTYGVEVDFEIRSDTSQLAVQVTGNDIVPGIELPWNGVGVNGCTDMLIGRCPLYEYDYVTYAVNLLVLPAYPNVDLTIKWRMRDQNGTMIWCFMLPASIRPDN